MTKRYEKEGNWGTLIEAQAKNNEALQEEEGRLRKLSKEIYKKELDNQLREKFQNSQRNHINNLREREMFQAKERAACEVYEKQREHQRQLQKIFSEEYKQASQTKQLRMRNEKEHYQKTEKDYQKKIENQITEESNRQKAYADQVKQMQRNAMKERDLQKQLEKEQALKEKEKEREMINKSIEQMKARENSFRQFYNDRLKRKSVGTVNFKNFDEVENEKKFKILKRHEEWDKRAKEKEAYIEKLEQERRAKAIHEIRAELDKQIQIKRKQKEAEITENKRYLERAKWIAQENEAQQRKLHEQSLEEQQRLKEIYDKQLSENSRNSPEMMDHRERDFNKNVLKSVELKRTVAFPGVPGAHNSESPYKHNLQRVYMSSKNLRGRQSPIDVIRDKDFVSNQEAEKHNKSFNYMNTVDTRKHDPIVNPIGINTPISIPGQRYPKGSQFSNLARAGNSIFN